MRQLPDIPTGGVRPFRYMADGDIAPLLLRQIIKDMGTTPEEFLRNR